MADNVLFLGIDFGTTNSAMAWYNPDLGLAEVIRNRENEEKTRSIVYFPPEQPVVGTPAENALESAGQRPDILGNIVRSIKRDLVSPHHIALSDGSEVTPTEVVAEILRKLKRDADRGKFNTARGHSGVERAVIAVPALFDPAQRSVIIDAAKRAGFTEVVLIEEPVAAAIAFAQHQKLGENILVYDIGGGTLDLAVVARDGQDFHVVLEPRGDSSLGGDDFDYAVYNYCDRLVREEQGRSIAPVEGQIDLYVLDICRRRKELLSSVEKVTISAVLQGGGGFSVDLDRETYERMIDDRVRASVQRVLEVMNAARKAGHPVDTIVLIGGPTETPLISTILSDTLPIDPMRWHQSDLSVALGCAYYGQEVWGGVVDEPEEAEKEPPVTPPKDGQDGTGSSGGGGITGTGGRGPVDESADNSRFGNLRPSKRQVLVVAAAIIGIILILPALLRDSPPPPVEASNETPTAVSDTEAASSEPTATPRSDPTATDTPTPTPTTAPPSGSADRDTPTPTATSTPTPTRTATPTITPTPTPTPSISTPTPTSDQPIAINLPDELVVRADDDFSDAQLSVLHLGSTESGESEANISDGWYWMQSTNDDRTLQSVWVDHEFTAGAIETRIDVGDVQDPRNSELLGGVLIRQLADNFIGCGVSNWGVASCSIMSTTDLETELLFWKQVPVNSDYYLLALLDTRGQLSFQVDGQLIGTDQVNVGSDLLGHWGVFARIDSAYDVAWFDYVTIAELP